MTRFIRQTWFPISVWIRFALLHLKAHAEYRGAYIVNRFALMLRHGGDVVGVWIVVSHFGSIGPWTAEEVIFLYGLNVMSWAIAGFVFWRPMVLLDRTVRDGGFDVTLTKPLSPLGYTLMSSFTGAHLSHVVLGLALLVWAGIGVGITWSLMNILYMVLVWVGGALIHGAGFLWLGGLTVRFVRASALANLVWFGRDMVRFPITIYPLPVQIALTIALPFAFINFYPAQHFLSKDDFGVFHPVLQHGTIVVGITLFLLAVLFFNRSVDKYQSAGS